MKNWKEWGDSIGCFLRILCLILFNNDLSNVWAFVVKFMLFTTFCVSCSYYFGVCLVWTVENRMDHIKYC